jgi:hypothetical protein
MNTGSKGWVVDFQEGINGEGVRGRMERTTRGSMSARVRTGI